VVENCVRSLLPWEGAPGIGGAWNIVQDPYLYLYTHALKTLSPFPMDCVYDRTEMAKKYLSFWLVSGTSYMLEFKHHGQHQSPRQQNQVARLFLATQWDYCPLCHLHCFYITIVLLSYINSLPHSDRPQSVILYCYTRLRWAILLYQYLNIKY
jgi:hypothetical protein